MEESRLLNSRVGWIEIVKHLKKNKIEVKRSEISSIKTIQRSDQTVHSLPPNFPVWMFYLNF